MDRLQAQLRFVQLFLFELIGDDFSHEFTYLRIGLEVRNVSSIERARKRKQR